MAEPLKFAYADPPYLGTAAAVYGSLHPDAGVWDDLDTHLSLVEYLQDNYPDGWALSGLPRDLCWMIPAAPTARICVYVKTYHQTHPIPVQYAWEPLLLYGGRRRGDRPKVFVRDWHAAPGYLRNTTPGTKPESFNRWVLDLLGYQDGDTLDDLFPGSYGMAATLAQGVLDGV